MGAGNTVITNFSWSFLRSDHPPLMLLTLPKCDDNYTLGVSQGGLRCRCWSSVAQDFRNPHHEFNEPKCQQKTIMMHYSPQ